MFVCLFVSLFLCGVKALVACLLACASFPLLASLLACLLACLLASLLPCLFVQFSCLCSFPVCVVHVCFLSLRVAFSEFVAVCIFVHARKTQTIENALFLVV